MSLKFYTDPVSQPCRAVQCLLDLLEIPYEKVFIDLEKSQEKSPEYLAIHPLGQIPSLEDDGYVLWESEAMMKYIISSRNKGLELYPLDPKIRGNIDKYFPFHHSVLRPKMVKYWHFYYKFLFPTEKFAEGEVIKEEAEKALEIFDEVYLKDKKYINPWWTEYFNKPQEIFFGVQEVNGDELTIADLSAVNEFSSNYYATDLDIAKYPRVKAYVERCLGNPVIANTQGSIKKFPEDIKAYLASLEEKK